MASVSAQAVKGLGISSAAVREELGSIASRSPQRSWGAFEFHYDNTSMQYISSKNENFQMKNYDGSLTKSVGTG